MTARATESTRAIQETFETRFLRAAEQGQTNANANNINHYARRLVTNSLSGQEILDVLNYMSVAFDKANVPRAGRVFICDPALALHINEMVTISHDTSPFAANILNTGFSRDHKFIMNLYDWDIITSNRLPSGTFSDGTRTANNAVANQFMCLLDDQTKSVMGAWRRMPTVESQRNIPIRQDEFFTTCRYGFGTQRLDTFATYITPLADTTKPPIGV